MTLECTINQLAIPPTQMHWSFNGRLLKGRQDLVITAIDEVTSSLRIVEVGPEDGGLYSCLADGGSSKPATVDVKIGEAISISSMEKLFFIYLKCKQRVL